MSEQPELERLYDDHAQALYGFLLNLTRHEANTRDLLQEIFVKLARQPSLMDKVRSPRSFLLRLAHHTFIDRFRREKTRARYAGQLADDPALTRLFADSVDPDVTAFRHALSKAMEQLPSDQKAVVHLKLWEKMTFDEIANTLEIPPNTAASRFRYGLDKLRDQLRPLYDEIK
jgi:RNA polymerase sigma-70 factor (ECF subfamily)